MVTLNPAHLPIPQWSQWTAGMWKHSRRVYGPGHLSLHAWWLGEISQMISLKKLTMWGPFGSCMMNQKSTEKRWKEQTICGNEWSPWTNISAQKAVYKFEPPFRIKHLAEQEIPTWNGAFSHQRQLNHLGPLRALLRVAKKISPL